MTKTLKLYISLFIIIVSFQACGGGEGNSNSTTLGESASVTTNEAGAVMAPNPTTLKGIGDEVSEVLKTDIITLNQKEAISFIKETNYCDVSGLINSENSGTLTQITSQNHYEACKTEKSLRNGKLNITYDNMDNEGKYPKKTTLSIEDDYTFNEIELKKDLTVQSDIVYDENKNITSITVTINGVVNYKRGTYTLRENKQTITY